MSCSDEFDSADHIAGDSDEFLSDELPKQIASEGKGRIKVDLGNGGLQIHSPNKEVQ